MTLQSSCCDGEYEIGRGGRVRARPAPVAVLVTALAVGLFASASATAQTGDSAGVLEPLFDQIRELRRPQAIDGLPDYSPAAVAERTERVGQLRGRLEAIDVSEWSVADRVDYLLARAQLSAAEFDLRIVRAWARDPGVAVDAIRRIPYAEVPTDRQQQERLERLLAGVSEVLARASEYLSQPSGELARMAIRQLDHSDGVNQGEPWRQPPPAGVIGWYGDLIQRLEEADSELVVAACAARDAVESYRSWLVDRAPSMTEPAWVGLEQYDWYLRNVLLMPFDSSELRMIGERELARARTFLVIDRHRNRGLPEIVPAASAEEHAGRVEAAEALIRSFIDRYRLMTVPPELPGRFETDAFWIVRAGGKRHFWEEITYRDPLNNHLHASIPGHRFDALLQRRETRPIRRGYRDGVRSEGWAFYIEEMFVQAGLLDERPRARELFYIAQLKRAARIPAELDMQRGAIDYLVEQVPLMEEDLARYDLSIYLRRPTYGMNYVMGKVQLERLLSDRALQLGDEFDLGEFHDAFLAAGPIPISLIRWEMTGLDDDIPELW